MKIILERRGTMYDPAVVDVFARTYRQVMPAPESAPHPAARAVGAARAQNQAEAEESASSAAAATTAAATPAMLDELAAFTSLSRAVCGEAGLGDVGALVWMMVRQVVPCESMALFVPDEATDTIVARHASGPWGASLRHARFTMGQGPVGWTAVNRRSIVNGEILLDGAAGPADDPIPCRVCTIPLVHDGDMQAVVALYASPANPFGEHHAQILELLAPRLAAAVAALVTRHTASDPVEELPARRPGATELRLVAGARS
jgi:hypothetical protein